MGIPFSEKSLTMADADVTRRVVWLTRLLGVGGLALMGVTWKLWTPQDVFPRVPLFWWAPPHWLDWTALAITVVGLMGMAFAFRPPCQGGDRGGSSPSSDPKANPPPLTPPWQGGRGVHPRLAAALTACGFALLFLSDQHRLQPWAWQFFILATVLALADDRTVFYGWRWLVVSIYFWSAVSKFDMAFVDGIGALFVATIGQAIQSAGISMPPWLKSIYEWNALLFPLGELTIAVLLSVSAWRNWGAIVSVAMHICLLLLLGPLGLNHSFGVLLWNVFFIAQNIWLFASWTESSKVEEADDPERKRTFARPSRGAVLATQFLAFVLIWPFTEHWGWCDPWTAWAVYAERSRDVAVFLEPAEGLFSASEWQPPTGDWNSIYRDSPDTGADGWNVRIGTWSLKTLAVPTYPSHRFQIGVALDLIERGCRNPSVQVYEQKSRFSRGQQYEFYTDHDRIDGVVALEAYARTFRLNAFPESYYRRLEAERRAAVK